MFKLPIRTWVCNAAAVFSGPHGPVKRNKRAAAECSRETVSQHARKVEQRLAVPPADNAEWAGALRRRTSGCGRRSPQARPRSPQHAVQASPRQRQFTTAAFAMGVSPRPIEEA